ncbi:MAG: hypothetical protein ABIZ49_09720 [Opitutaceae bacterium]
MNADPLPPPVTRPPRKWLRWLIGGTVAATVLPVVFVLWSQDEPAPDTRDLLRPPLTLHDDDNAFRVLVRAAENIDARPWADDAELFSDLVRGKTWNADRAALWLSANAHAWPAILRATSLPASQGPVIKSLGEVVPEIGPLRQLIELARLRAWYLFHTGQPEEAFAWLIACLHATQRVTDSNSTLLIWLTGISTHNAVLQTIEALVSRAPVTPAMGRKLVEALHVTRPSAGALANVIGNEHIMARLTVELVKREGVRRALGGESVPTLHTILLRRLRAQSVISATHTLIALRLHELEYGSLPEKLSDLVPAYLPHAPRDYYDGASIRYSREFRAIWSVGKTNLSIASPDPKVDAGEIYLKLPPRNR